MAVALQAVSLAGAALILSAFVLLQRGTWSAKTVPYLLCNFTGAAALTAVAIVDRRLGFILLEGTWSLVSLWSLLRLRRR